MPKPVLPCGFGKWPPCPNPPPVPAVSQDPLVVESDADVVFLYSQLTPERIAAAEAELAAE